MLGLVPPTIAVFSAPTFRTLPPGRLLGFHSWARVHAVGMSPDDNQYVVVRVTIVSLICANSNFNHATLLRSKRSLRSMP